MGSDTDIVVWRINVYICSQLFPGDFLFFYMASDEGEEKVKTKSRKEVRKKDMKRKEVQAEDIEDLTSAGHHALQKGQTDDALSCFNNALQAARQLKDSRVLRACSFNLGAAYVEAGQPQEGLNFLQQAQPGSKANRIPDLQFNLALAHNALGQSQEAADHFLQAAQMYRSQGDGASEGDACMEMSRCYSREKDCSLAVQGFLRAAESYRVASKFESAAAALKEAGSLMIQSDQFSHDDIIGVLNECLSLTESITDPRTLGEVYLWVGVSYCRLRCFQESVQCFHQAVGPSAQHPPLLAQVLHNLGAALNSEGRFKPAVSYHRQAAELYGSLGCRGDQARCFSNLALACSQLGDEEEASESFILALQGFRDTKDYLAEVQVCESLAECYLKQRKQQKAVQLYKQALNALTHCKNTSGHVQEHLIERLTAALRQSLLPLRPHPHLRPHLSPPVGHLVKKSDVTQSPGRASNKQPDHQRREGAEQDTIGRQETPECSGLTEGGATEAPDYTSMVSGHHSSDQLQNSDLWSDRENPPTDSETSLVQRERAQPTSPDEITEATSTLARLRSRFCSLM